MLNTIQKHTLLSFLSATVLCLTIIVGLTVMLDFVQRIDDFSQLFDNSSLGWEFVITYYLVRLPFFTGWLIPIVLLTAVCVTLVRMNRKSQLVPFMMAGFSIHQILFPVYITCVGGAIGNFAIQEWFLPSASNQLAVTKQRLKSGTSVDDILLATGEGTFLQSKKLETGQRKMNDVTLMSFKQSTLREVVKAERAIWDESKQEWIFRNGRRTGYTPKGYRVDTPNSFDTWHWNTSFGPDDILKNDSDMRFFKIRELLDMIERWPYLRFARMKLHTRFSYPFLALILPFFGIPILLRREIKSYFLGGVYCALVTIAVYLLYVLFLELGNSASLHPILASWFPIIVTGSACIYLQEWIMT